MKGVPSGRALTIALFLGTLLITGCGPKKQLYYFGDYSETLYYYKKVPTAERKGRYREELRAIIEVSQERGSRVPPGICAEYAYLLMSEGEYSEAGKYLAMEEELYPESKRFVQFLRDSFKEKDR